MAALKGLLSLTAWQALFIIALLLYNSIRMKY